jgi:hypothetical protein
MYKLFMLILNPCLSLVNIFLRSTISIPELVYSAPTQLKLDLLTVIVMLTVLVTYGHRSVIVYTRCGSYCSISQQECS